jgi:hypothetical protein
MDERALEVAASLHAEATELVYKRGLHDALSSFGAVFYTGSFALDLMAWPDIDISLQLKPFFHSIDKFFEVGNRVAECDNVVSMKFHNFHKFPIPELPPGLYWNAKINRSTGPSWKIDIWSTDKKAADENRRDMERIKKSLTQETRKLILDVKYSLITDEGRTPVLSGYHIYQAVLVEGLKDREAIVKYLRDHGIDLKDGRTERS